MFNAIFHNNTARTNDDLVGIVYTRKSSEKGDSNTSLQTQAQRCLSFADQHGIYVPDEYVFADNYSGMQISRPEFNKVLRLLRDGKANCIIVHTSDRLTRNMDDGPVIRNEFKRLGVRYFTVSRGEVGYENLDKIFNYLDDYASQEWRDRLVEATTRGKKEVIDNGVWLGIGRMKYGYERVGDKLNARVIIVDDEARIIRLIFDLFVNDRLSPTEIVDIFNAKNVPTRSESRTGYTGTLGKWRPENIYNILKDEAYIGNFYANKYNDTREFKEQRKTGIKIPWIKPKEEWICIRVDPIISRAIFDKAQELLAEGRSRNARKGNHSYLIGRLVECGSCGYNMVGKPNHSKGYTYHNYVCPANHSRFHGKVCNNTQYKADSVDESVWNWCVKLIRNPRAMIAAYKEAQKEIDADLQDTIELVAAYDRALVDYRDKLSHYSDLYAERLITKDIFKEKKMLLDQQILGAEQKKREAEEQLNQRRITDNDIRHIETFAAAVRKKVDSGKPVSFEEKRKLIQDLNLSFKLVIEEGRKVVIVYWAIYETAIPVRTQSDVISPSHSELGAKCVLVFRVLLLFLLVFLFISPHPIHANTSTVHKNIHVIYVQPSGEEFTSDEINTARDTIQDAINYWQELSPITTTLTIASTQLITTEYDVLSDPGMVLQLESVQFAIGSFPIVVIDNSNSKRTIYDNSIGIASYAAMYVISSASAHTYAHEFGHALYDLPHQYQTAYDIMNLDPYAAYHQHTIGCASLQVLGKPCQQIYLPIINSTGDVLRNHPYQDT